MQPRASSKLVLSRRMISPLLQVMLSNRKQVQVPDVDASPQPDCSCDQKQPCSDEHDPDGSRDEIPGRCQTFEGDGCRHSGHHAKVHDPDDQKDRRQPETALAAVQAEAQALSPGRAGVRRQRPTALG